MIEPSWLNEYQDDGRPTFTGYYLRVAQTVALRGDCRRSQVGAVLVLQDGRTAFFGYNGTPEPGQRGCLLGGCPRGLKSLTEIAPYSDYSNCIARHAEENALLTAINAVQGKTVSGAKMYTTRQPCDDCQDLIFGTGDLEAVYWLPFGLMNREEWVEKLISERDC